MPITGVHHVAVICSDYPASRRFYTEVLGLSIVRETYRQERRSYKLDLAVASEGGGGGVQIELFSFPDAPARLSYPEARGLRHLAFAVTDLDSEITRLRGLGIKTEPVRLDELTGQRFTFFADPDGLPLELYEQASDR